MELLRGRMIDAMVLGMLSPQVRLATLDFKMIVGRRFHGAQAFL
jgi:hypothetical protein